MKQNICEFMGAFAITFLGAYSRINNEEDLTTIGITYFMIIVGLVYTLGYITNA